MVFFGELIEGFVLLGMDLSDLTLARGAIHQDQALVELAMLTAAALFTAAAAKMLEASSQEWIVLREDLGDVGGLLQQVVELLALEAGIVAAGVGFESLPSTSSLRLH